MPEGTTPIAPFADAVREGYRFEREIGAGGMATVFLATDLKHDRLDVQPGHTAFAQDPERRPGVRGGRREASPAALTM